MSGWKHAFSLSRAEVQESTPPGTVRLVGHISGKELEDGQAQQSSGPNETVRFPRPSSDPADPLNWAPWRKFCLLLVAGLYAFVGNFISSSIASALQVWYTAFPNDPRPFSTLVQIVAVNVLHLGASNIWWVPLSNIFGRRPVLLAASLLMTLCSMWCGLATSFDSLLVARIFQGIGGGPSETVAPALIGEVFFMDERGRAMAVYTVLLAAGPLVGGISGGYTGFQHGWAAIFWVSTGLSAALFLGIVFFVPETLYDRKFPPAPALEEAGPRQNDGKGDVHLVEDRSTQHRDDQEYRPFTFARSLGFCKMRRGVTLQHFLQPWRTLALPGTWVVMLQYAGLVGGVVTISVVGAQLVSQPPYLWGANVGLINIGSLIGVLVGAMYTYVTSDARLLGRAKHEDHGFAEPEDRLPTMFVSLGVATVGFFVFGFCAQHPAPGRWVGLEFGYGMLAFGVMQIPSIGFNYLIDSYSVLAGDCFVMITILRSIIAFAWTFFVSDWISSRGPAEPFGIFGMLMGLFSLLVIPLWLLGKRMRIATASSLEISS